MRDIERMLLLPVYGHRVDERDAPAAVAHRDPLDPADPFRHGEVADTALVKGEGAAETAPSLHLVLFG